MSQVIAVKPNEVDHVWPEVSPLLCKALEYDPTGATIDSIYTNIIDNRYLLILMIEEGLKLQAALTIELFEAHGETVCNIVAAGGTNLNDWCDTFLDSAEVLAKEQGASKLTINGRPGWSRRLKKRGFRPVITVLEKPLK